MAKSTVTGKGIEDEVEGKAFTVVLDSDTKKWTASGANVDAFFQSKVGTFKIVGTPENGTQLVRPGPVEVAFFKDLNGTSGVGANGTGRAPEKAVNFNWKRER